jgi:hexosaminidase
VRPLLISLGALAAYAPSTGDAPQAAAGAALPMIPYPAQVSAGTGAFSLRAGTTVVVPTGSNHEVERLAGYAARSLAERTGLALPVERADPAAANAIILRLAPQASDHAEGYRLRVSPDRVMVEAAAPAGLFYGVQTLLQLTATNLTGEPGGYAVPAVEIQDRPRFTYRGMHLDVGRHFFPVEFVKRYVDLMAGYKFNTFHWHLTEDQGWRIEIKRFPRLTEAGAYRKETVLQKNLNPYVGDGVPYGGFYTQDQIREVVAYAAERYVTVIPEIELPGHSQAALAAYPELGCTPGPFEVSTTWGVHYEVFCPSDTTFAFLEGVLTEVMELFPSRNIHIGGDEVPKDRWRARPLAQELIRRERLAGEHELQSWFIRRIERFLLANGRRLIGWDEILEGGLAPAATVMSWRGMDGGIEAARQGHDVIMTPTSHVYFDYYQGDRASEPLAIGGFTPLDRVYSFEPVPEVLTAEEARYVLGAQGNVWTEYMKTERHVEYMVFPRLLALAEVVWSPKDARDWSGFTARLPAALLELDRRGVNYRIPDVVGLEGDVVTTDDSVRVALSAPIAGGAVAYTLNRSPPTGQSARYERPFWVRPTAAGVTVTARVVLPDGRMGAPRSARFRRVP